MLSETRINQAVEQQNRRRIPFFDFVKRYDNRFGDRAVAKIKGHSINGKVSLRGY